MRPARLVALVTVASLVFADLTLAVPRPAPPLPAPPSQDTSAPPAPVTAAVRDAYGRLPLAFEENRGQTDSSVRFIARGPGYTAFLAATEATLVLGRKDVVTMSLIGAAASAPMEGRELLPGRKNYFIGRDPSKWRTDIPTYARVQSRSVYPGIDVVYYGNPRQLEYDFVVAPGADPGVIRLAFEGAERLWTDTRGDLVLSTRNGELRMRQPHVYQQLGGHRRTVTSAYRIVRDARGSARVAIDVGGWDRRRALVIDPALTYATYLGGSSFDAASGMAIDASGNTYLVGTTTSGDFPLKGSTDTFPAGAEKVFVTKLNPTGTALVYSTVIGGNLFEFGNAIAVDAAGNAFVTGATQSDDFPASPNAFQPGLVGNFDVFVLKLNPAGSAIVYATYLGGSSSESGKSIAVNAMGQAYVTGTTVSGDFPTVNALQGVPLGDPSTNSAFVTKLTADGTDVVYSTYLGGSNNEDGRAIAVDAAGNAYVGGRTMSPDFPTTLEALQPVAGMDAVFMAVDDGFVTKLSATGTLVYSTFLGGNTSDAVNAIAVDSTGAVVVAGETTSVDFPTVKAFQAFGGATDAFVAKINPAGSALVYSSYLGGAGIDRAVSVALSGPNVWVGGTTTTNDLFAQTQPFGGGNSFVFRITPAPAIDQSASVRVPGDLTDIAADAAGNVTITGQVSGADPFFFATGGAFKQTIDFFDFDAFVIRLRPAPRLIVTGVTVPSPAVLAPGKPAIFTVTVKNTGDGPSVASPLGLSMQAVSGGPAPQVALGSVGALATGANVSVPLPVTVGRLLAAGNYVINACVGNPITSCLQSAVVRVPNPDLAVTAVTVPPGSVLTPGRNITVTVITSNRGEAAAAPSTTRVYLQRVPGPRLLRGSIAVGPLAPNANASMPLVVTIPKTEPAGSYVFHACADATFGQAETDEDNNCADSVMLRVPRADLVISDFTLMAAGTTAGNSVGASVTLRNQGDAPAAASLTRFFLSPFGVPARFGRVLSSTLSFNPLTANQSATLTTPLAIPASTAPGMYFVTACADERGVTAEADELNNCTVSSALDVTLPPAPMRRLPR